MTRAEVYRLVDTERALQDRAYPRKDQEPAWQQYQFAAPHVLLLEEQVAKLRTAWYTDNETRERLVKAAAIAVRALEEITVWE